MGRIKTLPTRFTLRGLLALILLVGAWLAYGVNRYHREQAAMTEITKQGGQAGVCFSIFYPFRCIESVAFTERTFGDAELGHAVTHLREIPSLTCLQLHQTGVTDRGLSHLGDLGRLTRLDLFDNKVSDDGLTHIIGLQNLTRLDLSATLISDKGAVKLETMQSLRHLTVSSWSLPRVAGRPAEPPDVRQQREEIVAQWQPAGIVTKVAIGKLQRKLPRCAIQVRNYTYSGSGSELDHRQIAIPSELLNGNYGY